MPIMDGFEACTNIYQYLKGAIVGDLIGLGQDKNKSAEHFDSIDLSCAESSGASSYKQDKNEWRYLHRPLIYAFTADVNSEGDPAVKKRIAECGFDGYLEDLNSQEIEIIKQAIYK